MGTEFFVQNLGCKVNRVESDNITASLLAAGATQTDQSKARLILINTCTVTGEADAKTRKAIRAALAADMKPWVIATGCAIAIERESYLKLGERVIAEPDRELAKQTAMKLLELNDNQGKAPMRIGNKFNTRMGIKIQDGCDNACSYCIVHVARGRARSMDADDIISQAKLAEESGVREIVLTGVNIGAYSAKAQPHTSDDAQTCKKGEGLVMLLDRLVQETSHLRLRISSLEPDHATDNLLELMAASQGRICAHLHLPLQSGCNKTLKSMARSYNTDFFAERVAKARQLMSHIALTTDLIVGFAGESESDFEDSLKFCENMTFSRMHVFRYSARPKTPAAALPAQVSAIQKAERSLQARALAKSMEERDLCKRVGTTELVLIERAHRGRSESYHAVEIKGNHQQQVGALIPMHFTQYRDNLLIADK